MECPSCFDFLSPSSVGSHILHRHFGRVMPQWACGLCVFAANAFADALAHGLLHGHPVDKLRDLTSSANKSSKERAWTAVKRLQLTTSAIQSDSQDFEAGTKLPIALNENTRGEEWTEMCQRICEGRKDKLGEETEEGDDCDDVTSRNIGPTADEVPMSVDHDTEMLSLVTAENAQELDHEILKKVKPLMNSCCSQCGKSIVLFHKNRTRPSVNTALVHVGTCLSILSYACSQCGHRGASRSAMNYHLKHISSCFSASVIIPEPARDETRMKDGLVICFPQHSFTWNGFAATEPVSEPTEPTTEQTTELTEPTSSDGMADQPNMDSRCETMMNSRIETTYQDASNGLTIEEHPEQTESSCEMDTIEQEMSILYNEPERMSLELDEEPERETDPKLICSESNVGSNEINGAAPEDEEIMSRSQDQNAEEMPLSAAKETEMPFVAPDNSEEPELNKVKLLIKSCCSQCGKTIVMTRKNGTNLHVGMALAHVGFCLDILPYSCSRCGHWGASRSTISNHLKNVSSCFSASVIIPERVRDEERLRKGLALCFPQLSFTWNGFAAAQPVSEPTEPTTELTEPTDPASSNDQERESRQTGAGNGLETTAQEETDGPTNEENREETVNSCEMATNEPETNRCDDPEILPPELDEEPEREPIPKRGSVTSADTEGNEEPSSAVPESSYKPNHEKRASDTIHTLNCAKCEKIIRQGTESALSHVCSCLGIRPYACSNCDHRVNSRQNLSQHKKHNLACADATRVLPDREENEERLKAGLKLCFPNFEVSWSGFQTTENTTSTAKASESTTEQLAEEANEEPTDTPFHVTVSTRPEQEEYEAPQHDFEVEEVQTDATSNEALEERADSPQPTEEKLEKDQPQSLTCAKCSRVLRERRIDGALSHVCSCLEIRPYACSNCNRRVNSKQSLRQHQKSQAPCSESTLLLPDREENEGRLKAGLEICFPDFEADWQGFGNESSNRPKSRMERNRSTSIDKRSKTSTTNLTDKSDENHEQTENIVGDVEREPNRD